MPIHFTVCPELVPNVNSFEIGRVYSLTEQTVEGAVIDEITTRMTLSKRLGYRVFNLASIITPTQPSEYPDTIASDFSAFIEETQDSTLKGDIIKPTSSMGHVRVIDTSLNNLHCIVSPILGGQTWNIETVLDYFRTEGPEQTVLEKMFNNHVFVLNALTQSITELRGDIDLDEDNDEPAHKKIIILTNPETEDKSQEVVLFTDDQIEPEDVFSEFVGIDSTIEDLKQVIALADIPEEDKMIHDLTSTQAIILSGPSGVGKTELTCALAKGLKAKLIELNFTDLAGTSTGSWASNIAKKFEIAKNSEDRVILFFDEADGLLKTGNEGSNSNIESTLKKELENLQKNPNVFVVFATNNEASFSPEIRSKKRIQLTIRLEKPNAIERFSLFDKFLGIPAYTSAPSDPKERIAFDTLTQFPDFYDFQALTDATHDFTAGDIVSLIREVRTKHYLKNRNNPEKLNSMITQDELLSAIQRTKMTREA